MVLSIQQGVESLVADIRATRERVIEAIEGLKPVVDAHPDQRDPSAGGGEFWRLIFFYDALIRVRLLIEQNFAYIETLGLLATTRYLFELLVWMRLMAEDARYGTVYHAQLVDRQYRYWTDYCDHVRREMALFRNLQAEEEEEAGSLTNRDLDGYAETLRKIAETIDEKAARKFSLYGDTARVNGYGLQAMLLETKVLPELTGNAAECEALRQRLVERMPRELGALVRDWQWKTQAGRVGMQGEYAFIYTYCSRLLHATPVSVSTNQKNLELSEATVFLRFVRVCLRDIVDIVSAHTKRRALH